MKTYTITVNGTTYEVTIEEGEVQAAQPASSPIVTPKASASAAPVPVMAPKVPVAAPKAPIPMATPKAPAPMAAPTVSASVPDISNQPASGRNGTVEISAPMPGKVIAVKGAVGQSLKRGEVILILEAMKMENEIVAPQDGTIASINVSAGDSVESGQIMVSLN